MTCIKKCKTLKLVLIEFIRQLNCATQRHVTQYIIDETGGFAFAAAVSELFL